MSTSWSFLFDLDGTITKKEILPIIAKEVGLYEEIRKLTEDTIKGVIPFHESFLKRVELLKGIPVKTVQDIVSSVPLNEKIVQFIEANRDNCYIVTGNLDVWVGPLCKRIGVKSYTSQAEVKDGYITKVTAVLEKGKVARDFVGKFVAIGEGNNDAEMIKEATIGLAYGGVHSPANSVLTCASHAVYEEEQLCRFLRQLS
ncbi:HAD-IB family phosphatase [Paenibacillus alvei]|uniref:HAD-IB family phosphatase n=1 Tax=Paenibacillus alvei TaxID=44250 RepID=UPI0018CED2DF|nr:HAD family phosphatase [Paenibacillus alvei]MBG9732912.1 phosphoserine phosphatase [Paenibacillus alvei]MBG9742401.1 phosphoserine phosphatase [Paenibacillus alvei]MCY9582871.1 HAD family phosphatase [Paenibacillus alvei]MCY9587931.1 HAD family phosphatase [Paenibacillus alvei]